MSSPNRSRNSRGYSHGTKRKTPRPRPTSSLSRHEAVQPRVMEQRGEPFGFRRGDRTAEPGQPVVPPPLVVAGRTPEGLLDQAVVEHLADGAVERAGTHPHVAVRPLGDLLHDGVAVLFSLAEGDQDVEHGRSERQLTADIYIEVRHM